MNRRLAAFSIPTLLAGCAAQSGIVDGSPLERQNGVMALQISTNSPNGWIGLAPYTASATGGVARELFSIFKENFDLKPGDTYFARQMPPGDYMWNEVVSGHKKASLYTRSKMSIKAQTITYIGHVRISVYDRHVEINVLDREDDMRSHLGVKYPRLLASLPFEKQLAEVGLVAYQGAPRAA